MNYENATFFALNVKCTNLYYQLKNQFWNILFFSYKYIEFELVLILSKYIKLVL